MKGEILVELQDSMGNDKKIAEGAWTSSLTLKGKETRSDEDIKRVIEMLTKEGHATPFEHVVFTFWIRLPIAVDRQLMTHRIASHSGMSGRYRTMPDDFIKMPEDVKLIIEKALPGMSQDFEFAYNTICEQANKAYREGLIIFKEAEKQNRISNKDYKRWREFYRGVLPQHNMTERVTTMNLRSFANFIRLRNSEHAQPEIRQIAQKMLELVEQANICPIAINAIKSNGWCL